MPTHGSLTKAGKVRGQTPKIEAKPRASPISKIRNKNNYIKRLKRDVSLDKRNLSAGQDAISVLSKQELGSTNPFAVSWCYK